MRSSGLLPTSEEKTEYVITVPQITSDNNTDLQEELPHLPQDTKDPPDPCHSFDTGEQPHDSYKEDMTPVPLVHLLQSDPYPDPDNNLPHVSHQEHPSEIHVIKDNDIVSAPQKNPPSTDTPTVCEEA
jgi:hypothetical protein